LSASPLEADDDATAELCRTERWSTSAGSMSCAAGQRMALQML
jgi:protein involved in temperature-dependent protein secretion